MAIRDEIVPPQYDVNAKWHACLDLTVRRVVCSSAAGAITGFLFFRRRPDHHWTSIAFGAGYGIGRALVECSRIFDSSSTKSQLPKISEPIIPQDGQD